MILIAPSVRIRLFRISKRVVQRKLPAFAGVTDPFMIGALQPRSEVLTMVQGLPQSLTAHDREVIALIEARNMARSGSEHVDVHRMASRLLSPGHVAWIHHRRLAVAAASCGLGLLSP